MASVIRYVGTDAASAGAYLRAALSWSMEDFLRVFDLDGDGAVAGADEAAFVRVGCMAETEVDEALGAAYGAPFAPAEVTDSIREIAALRVPWCAVRGRALADAEKNPLHLLYKASEARIAKLRADAGARIPGRVPAPAAEITAGGFSVGDTPLERAFGPGGFGGF